MVTSNCGSERGNYPFCIIKNILDEMWLFVLWRYSDFLFIDEFKMAVNLLKSHLKQSPVLAASGH